MDRRTYRYLTMQNLRGRYLRLLGDLPTETGHVFPAGTVVQVVKKDRGFTVKGPPCPSCGVALEVQQLDPVELELLPPESESEPDEVIEANPGVGPWL